MKMQLNSEINSADRSDGRFCVSCSVNKTTHTLKVSSMFMNGMPVLKISKLEVPLCKHRFIWNCPRYLKNRKEEIRIREDFRSNKKESKKMIGKIYSNLKRYSCEAVFVMLMIGAVFFIRCSEKDWKSVLKEENAFIQEMFVETCNGNGFNSLDEWKSVCSEKFKLDYITWSRASEFIVENDEANKESEVGESSVDNQSFLYYGRWHGKNGYGEVYARKKD